MLRIEDIKKFRPAFELDTKQVLKSLEFSRNGEILMANSEEIIKFFSWPESKVLTTKIHTRKYGSDLCKWIHCNSLILHSSTKVDNFFIRLLDITNNKYVLYFPGHTSAVRSIAISPINDNFLSSGEENQVRLWDLRKQKHLTILDVESSPSFIDYHPSGTTFAFTCGTGVVKVKDIRNIHKNLNIFYMEDKQDEWTDLKFAEDGSSFVITTRGTMFHTYDSISGRHLGRFFGFNNDCNAKIEACFTPDSQYIMTGSSNGLIHTYDASSGLRVDSKRGHIVEMVSGLKFNRKFLMLASSSSNNLKLWLDKE